jgi:hypothetical protein
MYDKKAKRVSFSEFKANSLEEMQQLRLQKEKEFFRYLEMRNRANEVFHKVYVYNTAN